MSGIEDSRGIINRIVHNENQIDIKIDPIEIIVKNSEKTQEEIDEEIRIEQTEKDKENQLTNDSKDESNKNENQENLPNQNEDNGNNKTENANGNMNNKESDTNKETNEQKDTSNNNMNNPTGSDKFEENVYSISGKAWLDDNKNGGIDDGEKGLSGIKVYLLTITNNMLKSTVTTADGTFRFTNLKNEKYIVGYEFDETMYELTMFKKSGIDETKNSEAIEVESDILSATTNTVNKSFG